MLEMLACEYTSTRTATTKAQPKGVYYIRLGAPDYYLNKRIGILTTIRWK